MTQSKAARAWNQGYDAGSALLPSKENPYKITSKLHEAWQDGWYNGAHPEPGVD